MEPLNVPAGQPNKNLLPTILANSEWAKDAEVCSCNDPQTKKELKERVGYVCLDQSCPLFDS